MSALEYEIKNISYHSKSKTLKIIKQYQIMKKSNKNVNKIFSKTFEVVIGRLK